MNYFTISPAAYASFALALLLLCCPEQRAWASDIYVNPGSSITSAMASAQPGDTVHVNAGTYDENVQINTPGNAGAYISLVANGAVVVNAGGAGKAIRIAASYINVTGFEFTNYLEGINLRTGHIKVLNCNVHSGTSTASLVAGSNGLTVNFDSPLDGIDIEDCNFYFNDGAGADFGCNATTDSLTNLSLVNCKFYSNNAANSETGAVAIGHQGAKANISVIRCQAYDNLCSGFDMDAPLYMDGCIAHDNDRLGGPNWGVGIKVWGHTGNPPAYGQVTLVNCLAYNNTEETAGGGGINIGGTNSVVSNCLVAGNTSYAGFIICSGASVTIKNTIAYNEHYVVSTDSDVSGLTFDASNVIYNCVHIGALDPAAAAAAKSFDPQFVNPVDNDSAPWGDFHLRGTSPAIDAGVAVSGLSDDADGNPRPSGNGFDIGPYEFQQAISNVPPVLTSAPGVTPNPVTAGQSAAFAVAATDANGDPLTYAWDFGDGGTGTGATPAHVYTSAGSFTAGVTVSDNHGGSVSATVSITVVNPPPPPPPPPTKTVHIAAIGMSLSTTRTGRAATATLTVRDGNGAGVCGAVVSGSWSGLTSANVSGKTGAAGNVKFTSARIKTTRTGAFTFSVTNITLAGYAYAPDQNAVTTATITTSGAISLAATAAATAPSSNTGAFPASAAIDLGSASVEKALALTLPLPPDFTAGNMRLKSRKLPAGLHLRGAVLSGSPKTPGTFTFDVVFEQKGTIADDSGASVPALITTEQQYRLTVTR